MSDSICCIVSSATPTTMRRAVPPKYTPWTRLHTTEEIRYNSNDSQEYSASQSDLGHHVIHIISSWFTQDEYFTWDKTTVFFILSAISVMLIEIAV